MEVYLPDDIMHMICNELYLVQDFPTLFNCAISCRRLAPLALSNLYRIYSQSPNSDDAASGQAVASQALQRWSIAWRSIILSTMNGTAFPYYSYLRFLDLRDLGNMLDDEKFRKKIQTTFFDGELSKLHLEKEITTRKGPIMTLDIQQIVEAVGDLIAPKASILLEMLSGEFTAEAFLRWVPYLPRLQRLELYDGGVLADCRVHKSLSVNCPKFDSLSILRFIDTQSDHHMAGFLNALRPNTLKEFTTISSCGVSLETCVALNSHGASLRDLNVTFGPHDISALMTLGNCTSIENLSLEMPSSFDTDAFQRDIVPALSAWLSECRNLRKIAFKEFGAAPTVLIPILLNKAVCLEELNLDAKKNYYVVHQNREFHRALGQMRTLKALYLVGNGENVRRDDIDTLVDSLINLPELRILQLRGVSELLGEDAVIRLLSSLPLLEDVYVGGYGFSDKVLEVVATLQNLRSISFYAVTSFTCQGLLDFVETLGPGNEDIYLSIYMADTQHLLSDEEQATVRDALYRKVSGRMDYLPMGEPGTDYEDSDSD